MLVRPYEPRDRKAIEALAPRLLVGAAPWLDPERMLAAIRSWIDDSITNGTVFVAEQSQDVVGFATVAEKKHFTGTAEAYVGELAVSEQAERRGVGRALMGAVEDWARGRSLPRVSLETGAANTGARHFYAALGYEESDVRLSKRLT